MSRLDNRIPAVDEPPSILDGEIMWGSPPSLRRRGVTMVAAFWILIVALLGARVALFDRIEAVRLAELVSAWTMASSASLRPVPAREVRP